MQIPFLNKKRSKDVGRISGNGSEYSWNDEAGAIKTLNFNGYLTPLPAMLLATSNDIPPAGSTLAFFNTTTSVEYVKFTANNGTPATPALGTGLPVPPQRYVYFTVPLNTKGLEVSSVAIAVMTVQDSTHLG